MTAARSMVTPAADTSPVRSLIAVDGIDGSGKSVLAERLGAAAADLGINAVVLAVDDFRRPVDWGRRPPGDARSEADLYYEEYYDLPLLDQCLAAFLGGDASVEIPVFDSAAHRLDGRRTIVFGAATVAIVEGVFALRLANLATGGALIYVRTSFAAARERIVRRDTQRGRDRGDVIHRITARYFPAQERYLREFDPLIRADVLVDHEILGAPRIVHLRSEHLGPELSAVVSRALRAFATAPRSPAASEVA